MICPCCERVVDGKPCDGTMRACWAFETKLRALQTAVNAAARSLTNCLFEFGDTKSATSACLCDACNEHVQTMMDADARLNRMERYDEALSYANTLRDDAKHYLRMAGYALNTARTTRKVIASGGHSEEVMQSLMHTATRAISNAHKHRQEARQKRAVRRELLIEIGAFT